MFPFADALSYVCKPLCKSLIDTVTVEEVVFLFLQQDV